MSDEYNLEFYIKERDKILREQNNREALIKRATESIAIYKNEGKDVSLLVHTRQKSIDAYNKRLHMLEKCNANIEYYKNRIKVEEQLKRERKRCLIL